MQRRIWIGISSLVAALLLTTYAAPNAALACPRCSRDGVAESLVTGTFVSYDASTRAIRVRVESGLAPATYALTLVTDLSDRSVDWQRLARGARLELVVRERGDEREVIRARLLELEPERSPAGKTRELGCVWPGREPA